MFGNYEQKMLYIFYSCNELCIITLSTVLLKGRCKYQQEMFDRNKCSHRMVVFLNELSLYFTFKAYYFYFDTKAVLIVACCFFLKEEHTAL